MLLTIHLETYSPQDIGTVGAYRYSQDPDFEILLCSFAADDDGVKLLEIDKLNEVYIVNDVDLLAEIRAMV